MSKFHINSKGAISKCSAVKAACPFIDSSDSSMGHFETEEEAEAYLENKVEKESQFYRYDLPEVRALEELKNHKIFKEPGESFTIEKGSYSQKEIDDSIEARAVFGLMKLHKRIIDDFRSPYETVDDVAEISAQKFLSFSPGKDSLERPSSNLLLSNYSSDNQALVERMPFVRPEDVYDRIVDDENDFDTKKYVELSIESSKKLSKTRDEFNAISAWTSSGSLLSDSFANKERAKELKYSGGDISQEALSNYIELVDNAIKRATPEGELPFVYKGTRSQKFLKDYGIDIEALGEDRLVGQRIEFKTPSSTSVSTSMARSFGDIVLKIKPRHAAFTGAQSSFYCFEAEAVLMSGTKYEIKEAKRDDSLEGGGLLITLEEVL